VAVLEKKMRLQGTYHSDKMRRGDVELERVSWRRPRLGSVPPNPLIGTWKLESWENRRFVDGQLVSHPLGEDLGEDGSGYMTYNRDRYMFIDIRSPYRLEFASEDLLSGTRVEPEQDVEIHLSYCGRYNLREGKVIHHEALSSVSGWVSAGQKQEHLVELRGNQLMLSTYPISINGVAQTAHLIWKRV
jgi:hypothetical protein